MSKDPAFLFYTSDFLTGTMLMDDEQVGKYIRLLCLQHQKKSLTEKDMFKICGSYDEDVFAKFEKDDSGNFYNVRLRLEADKRTAFSESRRQNRKKKDESHEKDMLNISKTYDEHMENENENENINRDIIDITSIEKVSKKKPIQHSEESSEVMQWFISSFDTVAFDWNDAAMNRARQGIDRSIKRLQNKTENKGLSKDETIAMLKGIIKFVKDDAFWGTQFETPAKLMTNDKNGLNWLDRFINIYRQKSPELAKQRRDAETDRLIRNDEAQRERKKHEASQF